MQRVLIDTGPLVAFINRKDRYHVWARTAFGRIAPPLLTCEAVLAEACFLLRKYSGGSASVMELLKRNVLTVAFRLDEHLEAIAASMNKYAGIPMSLADACLVRMSEIETKSAIMTLDNDFRIYKRHGRQTIPLIIPAPD